MEPNILLNNSYCYSIKSKFKSTLQCSNKPKIGSNLCGKHINCKNIIYYGNINNIGYHHHASLSVFTGLTYGQEIQGSAENNINFTNDINNLILETFLDDPPLIVTDLNNKDIINKDIINEDKKIYEKIDLYERILNNIETNVFSIRKSIKHCKLNNIINTKNSKQILIKDLKKFIIKERYYDANKEKLIMIQSTMRKWIIQRRKKCYNDTDILTFTCKYDIPSKYFYIFNDAIADKKFAYDIRTLFEIINSNYSSCPYTMRKFTDDEKNKITDYCKSLENKNIIIKIEKPVLTEKEEIEMKMKDLFHKINMLDNYTDYNWFKNLGITQLIDLYVIAEDIWNYRSNMTHDAKKKIVQNGVVFNVPIQIIKNQKSVTRMRNILLTDFMRCISEGVDINEKKLGAILVLTALVEVSTLAAYALPHLIQI